MKRTDFLFRSSKHHNLPKDVEWQLTQDFFRKASTNTRPLMLGAVLFALAAYFQQATPSGILIWLAVQFLLGIVLHLLTRQYRSPKINNQQLLRFIFARIIIGVLIAAMFGCSLFLLPEEGMSSGAPIFIFMLMMIAIITVFRYAMLPMFSNVFLISLVSPQLLFFVLYPSSLHLTFLVLVPTSIILVVHLGNVLSQANRETISLNAKLKHEIEEHVKTKKSLEVIAMQDPLTHLGNRRQFDNALQAELQRFKRYERSFSIFYVDLDNFKPVNDMYGHDVGDLLLTDLAQRLKTSMRVTDTVARIGGDEFAIIAPGIAEQTDIDNMIKKLESAITEPFQLDTVHLEINASIGWANCPQDGLDKEALLKVADIRMYKVKNNR